MGELVYVYFRCLVFGLNMMETLIGRMGSIHFWTRFHAILFLFFLSTAIRIVICIILLSFGYFSFNLLILYTTVRLISSVRMWECVLVHHYLMSCFFFFSTFRNNEPYTCNPYTTICDLDPV